MGIRTRYFGDRAGKSFSEAEWRAWLAEIANRYRSGIQEFSLKSLGETTSRPDLTEREVYARLSDIIDGRFALSESPGVLQLNPTVVAHALGAALLAHLDAMSGATFAAVETEVTQWLDPIAGLDQRAEILRAAVSILVERGAPFATPIAGVLVTAWLQTQNVTIVIGASLPVLRPIFPMRFLMPSNSRMRMHKVPPDYGPLTHFAPFLASKVRRSRPSWRGSVLGSPSRTWFSIVSREVDNRLDANPDFEQRRAERYRRRVGVDTSGSLTVLGVALLLVDRDDGRLQALAPLDPRRLSTGQDRSVF